jgi:nucleoid-associated protein YgaU
MTNDAKLGLVFGVCLVIGVAIAFYRKELVPDRPPENGTAMAAVVAPPPHPRNDPPPVRAVASGPRGQNHTVQHGESLFSLAQQYYGDGHRYTEIYKVNRRVVSNPDYVAPGTVLFIPDLK